MENIIEKRLIDLCLKGSDLTGGRREEKQGFSYVTNPYTASYNKIYKMTPGDSENQDVLIAQIREGIKKKEYPNSLILTSTDKTKELEAALISHDFSIKKTQLGMYLPLPVSPINLSTPKGIDIREIKKEELPLWLSITEEAFGTRRDIRLYSQLFYEKEIIFWGLFCHNQMVSTLLLFLNNESAGIYLVATTKAMRGQRYGSLITSSALDLANDYGSDFAVLEASPLGVNVYKRLGFKEANAVKHYRYNKEIQ